MNQDIFSLNNKVIVLTGAAGLLGKYHAEAIASQGGNLVLLDINKDALFMQKDELQEKFSSDIIALDVDVSSEKDLTKARNEIMKHYGQINGLVNNAANNPKIEASKEDNFSRIENFPLEIWEKDLSVGLTGAFLCAKYFGPEINANKSGGSIVNISSDLGLIAPDQRLYQDPNVKEDEQKVKPVSYSVVKTGLIGLTRYLATYWPEKVRSNAICPGGVEDGQSEQFIKKISSRIPMGRMALPSDYQGVLVFLLSDASNYMTGSIIPVDGGRSIW